MGTIESILQWVLPSGFIASLLTWLVNRKLYRAKSVQEQQMIYKQLYEDIQLTLKQVVDEKKELLDAFSKLQAAVYAIGVCKYAHQCPVTIRMQKQPKGNRPKRADPTARSDHGKNQSECDDDTDGECDHAGDGRGSDPIERTE